MLEAGDRLSAAGAAPAPRGRGLAFWLLVALVVIVLDQAAKLYFNGSYTYGQRVNVLPIFDFTLVYNRGAAFSFLATEAGWQRWFFTALGVVAAIVITVILGRQGRRAHPRFSLALAMIMGGALGNVIDRVVYGHVVDFLLFYWKDWYYPAFNVADVAITCGAILLVLDELLRMRKPDPGPVNRP
ncbi:signal peptidase II [Bordetella genomosp. 11]|uniref:Lipoprotein signal peptidase n=1 Tax=Bordetella genomosp. 11 TaxID=1416808 RepID=A0A261UK27_9BORD|nr:signal peptidase II [Bordetella genomosp. 11]OZI61253.1 signal peptidase II [Bordetella genomosp. 11]